MIISGCTAYICRQLAVAATKIILGLSAHVHVHLQSDAKPVLKLLLAASSENMHPFSYYLVGKAV